MYILGISGGVRQGNKDGSATLVKDGHVIASVEEERLMRIKHATGMLPEQAIRFVLSKEGISLQEVDYIVFPGETYNNFKEILSIYIESKFDCCPEIELVNHHDAHCASAFYASGFEKALILSADLSGDSISTQIANGDGDSIQILERIPKPNSLGIFYSVLTQYNGFVRDNDEFKVMGLSSYGQRGSYNFDWFLNIDEGNYELHDEYLRNPPPGQPNPSTQEPIYNQSFIEKMGRRSRLPDEKMTSFYENIAASGQEYLENALIEIVTKYLGKLDIRRLCLAGGVALNCVANQKLMELDILDEIYIQPAASDAGLSLGAAYIIAIREGYKIPPLPDVYLGPEYSKTEIRNSLEMTNVKYRKIEDVAKFAAEKISEDKIVGWFQGRMEFGPRALGNRSILANPSNPNMQDVVNNKIKFREQFRPFCPSVLEEEKNTFFEGKLDRAEYMTITFDVNNFGQKLLPSITHVDNTARIQTVREDTNSLYYNLLQELKLISGYGVVLNTSFNVKGDPIVNTPFQALATFYGSGMDVLIMDHFVLEK